MGAEHKSVNTGIMRRLVRQFADFTLFSLGVVEERYRAPVLEMTVRSSRRHCAVTLINPMHVMGPSLRLHEIIDKLNHHWDVANVWKFLDCKVASYALDFWREDRFELTIIADEYAEKKLV